MLRAAGADLVLLLAVLHPARRLARLVERALEIGLEPLVEVHDARELERALAIGRAARSGSTTATCGRSRSMSIGPRACASSSPTTASSSPNRASASPATVARWRALGFDGALVGEALVRAADPAAAARAFVAAGCRAGRPGQRRPPAVRSRSAASPTPPGSSRRSRAGADAIGLNVVPGTPRELSLDEAGGAGADSRQERRRREAARSIVAITADASRDDLERDRRRASTPTSSSSAATSRSRRPRAIRRRTWKVLHLPAAGARRPAAVAADLVSRGTRLPRRRRRAALPRHRRRTASGRDRDARRRAPGRRDRPGGAGHPRRRPRPGQRRRRPAGHPGGRRRRRVGRRAPARRRRAADARTRSGSRCSSSAPGPPATTARTSPFGPTPVHAGAARRRRRRAVGDGARLRRSLRAGDADGRARAARDRLRRAPPGPGLLGRAARPARALRRSPDRRCTAPTGWPRPSGTRRPAARAAGGARRVPAIPDLRLYLKREDLAHTGAHKINNALGQALLTRRLGKTRVIAETGAGQHGVATATACALLDLPCVVYMGAEDIERQGPNVLRMRALGAEVRSVTSGHGDAQGRGQRGDARLGDERRDDPLRARLGDGPAPVPDDRPRPPAPDRRRGGGPARGGRGPAAGPRRRLRRRRLERDRAARPVHRRAGGPARGRRGGRRRDRDRPARRGDPGRHAGHPPRLALADAPGRATARSSRPTPPRPASTTRGSARSSPRSPRAAGSRSPRRPTARPSPR